MPMCRFHWLGVDVFLFLFYTVQVSNSDVLVENWTAIALIRPLFIEDDRFIDNDGRRAATFYEVSSPQQLQLLVPVDNKADNIIINFLDWQVWRFLFNIRMKSYENSSITSHLVPSSLLHDKPKIAIGGWFISFIYVDWWDTLTC